MNIKDILNYLLTVGVMIGSIFVISSQISQFILTLKKGRLLRKKSAFYDKYDQFYILLDKHSLDRRSEVLLTEAATEVPSEDWERILEETFSEWENEFAVAEMDREELQEALTYIESYFEASKIPPDIENACNAMIDDWKMIMEESIACNEILKEKDTIENLEAIKKMLQSPAEEIERVQQIKKRLEDALESRYL